MRKVIQIATVVAEEPGQIPQVRTTALCDDGTVWAMTTVYSSESGDWYQQAPVPQDEHDFKSAPEAMLRKSYQEAALLDAFESEGGGK